MQSQVPYEVRTSKMSTAVPQVGSHIVHPPSAIAFVLYEFVSRRISAESLVVRHGETSTASVASRCTHVSHGQRRTKQRLEICRHD